MRKKQIMLLCFSGIMLLNFNTAYSADKKIEPKTPEKTNTKTKSENYQLETQNIEITQDTIAIVNGEDIKSRDFVDRLIQLHGNTVLADMVSEKLIEQQIKLKKPVILKTEVDNRVKTIKSRFKNDEEFNTNLKNAGITFEMLQKQVELDLKKEKLVEDKTRVTDEEIKQFFDNNKDKLDNSESIRVSHILVATQQEANDIIIALKAGADFATLAKSKTLDTNTKEKGGDLGFISRGMVPQQIEPVIFELKPGDISAVTNTNLGFHVFKCAEKQPGKKAVFDKPMQDKIKSIISQDKISKSLEELLKNLQKEANIKINNQ